MDDVLSNEALDDLERKRQAATPGPWVAGKGTGDCWVESEQAGQTVASWGESPDLVEASDIANAAYIAAANPGAIGKLIAEVKSYRAPSVFMVTVPETEKAKAAVARLLATPRARAEFIIPSKDSSASMLEKAAEFFEAMDASGDREPLTPSAIAHLLRECAADRRGRRQGHAGTLSPTEERDARIHHAGGKAWVTAKEFADGTRLLQRNDGTFILPPESGWASFFERVWEGESGTMGHKGGMEFLLKPKEKS